nr:hypothetical protein [Tanacetum cinerariifolium]
MNQNYFEPNYSSFDQPQQYSIDHQEDLNQQQMNNVIEDKIKESHNELLNMVKLFCEHILRQREQTTNLSINITEPSRRLNSVCYDDDGDYDDEEGTIPLSDIISQLPSSIVITTSPLVLPTEDPEDSLIMGNEDLSTIPEKESDEFIKSSVEDLVLILSEFEDTSGSNSECILPSCDDFSPINIFEEKSVTFSNPLFNSNDDFTSSDDESLSDEDVPEENVKIYSNPLFDDDVNPLFDEVLENIESKDSYDSNLDEPDLLVTPFSDDNKDECFDTGGDVFLDRDQRSLSDARIDNLMSEDKVFDPGICVKFFSPTYESFPFKDRQYLFFTYVVRFFLPHFTFSMVSLFLLSSGSEDTIFDPSIFVFHFSHRMSTPVFVDPKSSTQADEAQSSRVTVPLPKDPYEAIRQAYLVGMDTESKPPEGEARTPESPHIVGLATCHVEESEGSGTFGARSMSSNSIAPLSPDHPLTHTTPVLVLILRRTARMAVRVPPVMSPSLSAGMSEVAAMSDSVFRKRFRSSYDSSPSPTLPVRKRHRGTSKLILDTDSEEDEEVEESLDSDSESEDVEDEGPTIEDEDPVAEDEGLVVGVEGPGVDNESYGLDGKSHGVDDESYGLDGESHGVDDESHGLDDESYGIDGEGRGIESDGIGLGEEEAVTEGQHQAVSVIGTTVIEPLVLGRSERMSTFRQPTLTTWTDPEDGMVYIDVPIYPPPEPPVQTPPSPEWTSGSLLISPSPSVVPLLILSPMIPLTVPSPIASPMDTSTATISVDEDPFIEIDRDVSELYNRSGAVRDEIFSQRYRFRSLEHEQERTAVTPSKITMHV